MGRVLFINKTILKRKKGRFARIWVELDLTAPLRPLILINGKVKRVQYEGIHLICFQCGRYGHDKEHCPHKLVREEQRAKRDEKKHVDGEGSSTWGRYEWR